MNPYKIQEKDLTSDGLENLRQNYVVATTFSGGIVPTKTHDGTSKIFKSSNFLVEGVLTNDDIHALVTSELYGQPHGLYLVERDIKRKAKDVFNLFNEDEQQRFTEANLSEEAINMMRENCFGVLENYENPDKGSDAVSPSDTTGAKIDQESFQKYYDEYAELLKAELEDMITADGFSEGIPKRAPKNELIKYYILKKHNVIPELTA